jgi:hypothetical protein
MAKEPGRAFPGRSARCDRGRTDGASVPLRGLSPPEMIPSMKTLVSVPADPAWAASARSG